VFNLINLAVIGALVTRRPPPMRLAPAMG
jgi:hypothetical protein